jgi:hypothetical protein
MFAPLSRSAAGSSVRKGASSALLAWFILVGGGIAGAVGGASNLSAQVGHEHHDSAGGAAAADTASPKRRTPAVPATERPLGARQRDAGARESFRAAKLPPSPPSSGIRCACQA